jgi:hypothetical protein
MNFIRTKVPLWTLLLAVALLVLVCIVASVIFKNIPANDVPKVVSDISIELIKTIFIGVCVGWGVDFYLKHLESDTSKQMFKNSGIVNIYPSRADTLSAFQQLVNDDRTTTLYIAGISLRDFLTGYGSMHPVWEDILSRLKKEEENKIETHKRLRVYLLLLDPNSSEGYFRYKIEDPGKVDDPVDIKQGIYAVETVKRDIYKNAKQDFFQVRFYEHCPFSFIFLTEATVFVEQYYYKKQSKGVALPLIQYHNYSHQYGELQGSIDIVWANAKEDRVEIGTAIPLDKARISNIFRVDKRSQQSRRQIECIRNSQTGPVDILSITGSHYLEDGSDALSALRYISSQKDIGQVTVRFALLNPLSQQAIFRAVADGCATEDMKEALESYNWDIHRKSSLYRRVDDTIKKILHWRKKGHLFEIRLYSCSTVSALLLTSDSIFVGQYIYGRSKKLQETLTLKSEYPTIEYKVSKSENEDNIEQEILECTFKIIWDYYSTIFDEYQKRNREDEFNKNLRRLREELGRTAI